ncbi:MAG: class I SAM-dependent methyltransferase, partial [Phycisphaeraceae bacterium]
FNKSNMVFIKNNGTDFPGIEEGTIDYLLSFDAFVHLDIHLIEAYLKNIRSIVKPGANIVIHYADKTKVFAQGKDGFSDNTPDKMRKMVLSAGYKILEEDRTTMWHSSIVRFTI